MDLFFGIQLLGVFVAFAGPAVAAIFRHLARFGSSDFG